jgi:RNA polymerase sigma-70 factor (ECF subfamily)
MDATTARRTGTPPVETLLQHGAFVRGLARSLLRDDDEAQDVAQETWLAAVERRPRVEGSGVGWLARVTRNVAATVVRRRRTRAVRERSAARPEAAASVEEIAAREEVRRRVLRALLSLEPLHRDVLVLRFYDGLPPRRVARVLGVPVETARTRIRRALERLRARLDAETGDRRRWRAALAGWAAPAHAARVAAALGGFVLVAGVTGYAVTREPMRPEPPASAPADVEADGLRLAARAPAASGAAAEHRGAGAPSPSRESSPGPVGVFGTLRATDGSVPAEAVVYAHPREGPDVGLAPGLPRAQVEDTGEWRLALRDPEAWALRAFAPGFPPVEVASGAARGPIAISLAPGPRVTVHLRNADGTPIVGRHAVAVGSHAPRPSLSLRPLSDAAVRPDLWRIVEVPADGVLALTIGVPAPAYVGYYDLFNDSGSYAEPESVDLDAETEHVRMVLRPTCRISMEVRDAASDAAVAGTVPRLHLVDRRSGRRIEPRLGSDFRAGRMLLRTWTSIPPGLYDVRVEADGHETWSREGVDLPRPGDRVHLDVRMARDRATGTLRVEPRPPASPDSPEPRATMVRPHGTDAWRIHWVAAAIPLAPGSYDVLSWAMRSRQVGLVSAIAVEAGEVREAAVPLASGVEVPLAAGVPEGTAIRSVRLSSRALGSLPLLRMRHYGGGSGDWDDFAHGPPGRGDVLGPYPGDEVRVEVEAWDGAVHAWTATR